METDLDHIHKREYNSERRRKLTNFTTSKIPIYIRENITPRGDGNEKFYKLASSANYKIRENITPRGDGNTFLIFIINSPFL